MLPSFIDVTLECSKELIKIYYPIFVSIEVIKKLLSFFFCQIETVVDETPSKIINI
jgi:hypothetical protein